MAAIRTAEAAPYLVLAGEQYLADPLSLGRRWTTGPETPEES
jgi:hypothetical protein